jgi:4-carboxymuconolactone decarboxylase
VSEQDEKQAFIDAMMKRRGYVLEFHKTLTENDFAVMKAFDELVERAYLADRHLPRGIKELIYIAILTSIRARKEHIASHVRAAADHGVRREEILETMEIVLLSAGAVALQEGLEAWREEMGAEAIEPRAEVSS